MPLYDYRCTRCDKTFELLVKATMRPACPQCGNEQLEKLLSLPAATGKTAELLGRARAQAAREGHFSHYAPSERPRRKG